MIEVSPIEVMALKKLCLINHALIGKLDALAQREMRALFSVLNDITLRADADNHSPIPHKDKDDE